MPKSGSTLAFELVRGMLRNAGFEQETFINDKRDSNDVNAVGPGIRNFANNLTREKLGSMMAAIGPDRKIAVKTHAAMPGGAFGWLEEQQRTGQLQVVASYRDPREMCLSLLDASARARGKGKFTFGGKSDLQQAAQSVERRIRDFREWGALRGTLRLDYDTAAFLPNDAMARIEAQLGIATDRAVVKQYAFNEAFTQKNKARQGRYRELSPADNAELLERFGEFIRRVCDQDEQGWFDECRAGLLSA
jgi:hypothetical protein